MRLEFETSDKMYKQTMCILYSFVGTYDFEKSILYCNYNRDNLFDIEEQKVCENYIERMISCVVEEDIEKFFEFIQWKSEDVHATKETAVHFITQDQGIQLYKIHMIFNVGESVSQAVILLQRLEEKQEKHEVQDYMAMVSRLAFSQLYVLVGARDIERRFYENIYDAEDTLSLPRVCDFETFSRQIDQNIHPEDMAIYQQYIRNCDNEDTTSADFRMYDAKGELHYYQGRTCRIKTPVGDKHLFLLRKNKQENIRGISKDKKKQEKQKQIISMLSGLGYGFDTLIHVNLKTDEYILYEKRANDKKVLASKENFLKKARERIRNDIHDEDKTILLERFNLPYLQQYFMEHELFELEYRRKNTEGGYDWIRLLGRRIDKNKKPKDIIFCLISVSEEHSKNLTDRMRTKYLCEILENQNEYLNKKLHKADMENDIKETFKIYLAYEMNMAYEYILLLSKWAKGNQYSQDMINKLLGYMEIICSNMDIMKGNIIDIPEIERGSLSIQCEKKSLRNLIEEVTNLAGVESWLKEQQLMVDLNEIPDIMIETDTYRMKQLLLNLLLNEIRFSKKKAVICLTVSMTQTMRDGKIQYVICAENNGSYNRAGESFEIEKEGETRYHYRLYVIRKMTQMLHGEMFVSDHADRCKLSLSFKTPVLCDRNKD